MIKKPFNYFAIVCTDYAAEFATSFLIKFSLSQWTSSIESVHNNWLTIVPDLISSWLIIVKVTDEYIQKTSHI